MTPRLCENSTARKPGQPSLSQGASKLAENTPIVPAGGQSGLSRFSPRPQSCSKPLLHALHCPAFRSQVGQVPDLPSGSPQ
jgi:hypothetical protein